MPDDHDTRHSKPRLYYTDVMTRMMGALGGEDVAMTDRPNRLDDAAARLLDAVERLTGERPGEMHQRDTGAVSTRMAELIERAAGNQDGLVRYARWLEQQLRYTADLISSAEAVEIDDVLRQERAEAGVTELMGEATDGE